MAYNSSHNINSLKTTCSLGLVGFNTDFKGPAPGVAPEKVDIIDECLNYYRVNICMRNFPVKGEYLIAERPYFENIGLFKAGFFSMASGR
jgi:hypothetical protein